MWSQWPWVSSTEVTPSRRATLQQPIVFVGRVEQRRLAGAPAAHDVDVVRDRTHDEAVDLGGERRTRPVLRCPRPQIATNSARVRVE